VANCVASALVARLELLGPAVVPGGRLSYAVINTDVVPIMLGEAYGFERVSDHGWECVPLAYVFRTAAGALGSGSPYDLIARVPDHAQPGRYRLRKHLRADRDPHPGYEWVATEEIQAIELTAGPHIQPA
jgi:hypothetical protein